MQARGWLAIALLAFLVSACAKVEDHATFKTPDEAVNAFVAALQKDDLPALRKLLASPVAPAPRA